jgi:alpha-tubulin suppressor-like RCC1 family protein
LNHRCPCLFLVRPCKLCCLEGHACIESPVALVCSWSDLAIVDTNSCVQHMTPTALPPLFRSSRIVSAACGAQHSVALSSDGSLFTWGDGSRGQLGHSQLQALAGPGSDQVNITLLLPHRIARLDPSLLLPDRR